MEGLGFSVIDRHGSPAVLVAPEDPTGRLAAFCFPSSAAVVAGSSQPLESLDLERISSLGLTVVRRRSGGGAVFVAPRAQVWLDVYLPADDPLYRVDVSKASGFVGELWRRALTDVSDRGELAEVYGGPLKSSRFSRAWCFSGLGPGEVTVGRRKLVGLSQRRNRAGAWFFTMACADLDAGRDSTLVALTPEVREEFREELEDALCPLPASVELVVERLKFHLASI
jgi:lipoate-protein ligase A